MQCWKQIGLAVTVVALGFIATEGAETLKVTSKCGAIEFVGAKNDGVHKGGFTKLTGTVRLDVEKPAASRVVLEIDTDSLWSDNPSLTAHLRNADFFNVDKFPKAVFQSTAVRKPTPKELKLPGNKKITHFLSGKLTLLAVTKELDIPVKIGLTDKALSVEGTYLLDRTQFGMSYGRGKIHDGVEVTFALKIPRGVAKEAKGSHAATGRGDN
jgi:polyisoprenoid-binding protein YceI